MGGDNVEDTNVRGRVCLDDFLGECDRPDERENPRMGVEKFMGGLQLLHRLDVYTAEEMVSRPGKECLACERELP